MKYKFIAGVIISAVFVVMLLSSGYAQAAPSKAGSNVLHNGAVYSITADAKKRLYPSAEIFESYGWNSWSNITRATTEDIALPMGEPMPPRDGTVVCSNRSNDIGTCYLITDYKKAGFVSEQVLRDAGYSLERSITADISYVPHDKPIVSGNEAHRYGSLLDNQDTIYFVGKNGLIAFASTEVQRSWGYQNAHVMYANAADQAKEVKLVMEPRVGEELRPFEPTIPAPLVLSNKDKFIVPFAEEIPQITESWLYSLQERSIHGNTNHGGIDFAAPRGTPVYAAADGYAVSSTHLSVLAKSYEDKPIGFGLGEFVQIWHPEQGVYSSYSHLNSVVGNIPYFEPECDEHGFCDPEIVYHNPRYIQSRGKFVKQGDLIGYVGDSGLSWGYEETPRGGHDIKRQPSWDETHLHFEIYTRDTVNFFKAKRYDPFSIYGRVDQYIEQSYTSPKSLWKLSADGRVVLAE